MADRPLTLMAVHAHPDDEATSTGGVLAKYAAEGIQTILVTCTDGSCGDAVGGIKPGEPGHDPAAVVALRRTELEASCAVLNVTHLELLNYADSGMMGWPQNDAPDSFWHTPVDVAAARLAALMDLYQPDVVVTYDEYGFYGHPDHIQANRITVAALDRTTANPKLYWTTAPRSMMEKMGAIMAEFGESWDDEPTDTDTADGEKVVTGPPPEIGSADEDISAWVDTKSFGSQKFKALAAHASQGDNIIFLKIGEERFIDLLGVETFIRVRDTTGTPLPEDDLFAGLR